MILIDCPSCEAPLAASLPLPDTMRCDDCAVAWVVTDEDPVLRVTRLAA